ncbi:MAG: type II toxin-antitoxin system HicB family antitoxin [Microcystaceae cyanobacterium]
MLRIKQPTFKINVILEPSDEGGYTVYIPSLPGCISEGDDIDEALKIFKKPLTCILHSIINYQKCKGCAKRSMSWLD